MYIDFSKDPFDHLKNGHHVWRCIMSILWPFKHDYNKKEQTKNNDEHNAVFKFAKSGSSSRSGYTK